MLRTTAEVDRGESGLCSIPEGMGRRGELHPTALWKMEILFKDILQTQGHIYTL